MFFLALMGENDSFIYVGCCPGHCLKALLAPVLLSNFESTFFSKIVGTNIKYVSLIKIIPNGLWLVIVLQYYWHWKFCECNIMFLCLWAISILFHKTCCSISKIKLPKSLHVVNEQWICFYSTPFPSLIQKIHSHIETHLFSLFKQ